MTKGKERDSWIQALKRENPNRTKWNSKSSDRIGSLHFVDGLPTKVNPLPTMHKCYDTKRQNNRRPLIKHPLPAKKARVEEGETEIVTIKLIKLS